MPEETPAVDETTQEAPESDPQAEAPATEAETSTEETAEPASDYQKRYEDLRPQYDRTQSRLQQFEQFYQNLTNSETQAEALRALGLELEDVEELEDDDPPDPDERVDRIEQFLAEQQEHAQQAQELEMETEIVERDLATLEKEHGEFSDDELDILIDLADKRRDQDGVPDLKAAYTAFHKAEEVARKRYLDSKKAPGVGNGQAGTEKIDMSDDDARAQFLANALEAGAD